MEICNRNKHTVLGLECWGTGKEWCIGESRIQANEMN